MKTSTEKKSKLPEYDLIIYCKDEYHQLLDICNGLAKAVKKGYIYFTNAVDIHNEPLIGYNSDDIVIATKREITNEEIIEISKKEDLYHDYSDEDDSLFDDDDN